MLDQIVQVIRDGRSEYFGTRCPFGRPRCDIRIVLAPCSRR